MIEGGEEEEEEEEEEVILCAAGHTERERERDRGGGGEGAHHWSTRTLTFASPSSMPVALSAACHSLYAFIASRSARSSGTWHISFCPS